MKYFLDTTALVVHAMKEPGATEVQSLIANEKNDLFVSSLSLFELAGVLKRNGVARLVPVMWETYQKIAEVVPVDSHLACCAWELRLKTGKRLPIADAVIAASAKMLGATLVHRDDHLAQVPKSVVPQIRLPAR